MLTESERAELERLLQAATPGPWKPQLTTTRVTEWDDDCLVARAPVGASFNETSANSALIALLRNLAPDLLALDAEVGRLMEACRSVVYEFGGDDSAGLTDGERAAVDKCKATLTPAGDGEVGV